MIKNGSKFLPLTDPKMTRFFISMDECVSFISNCLKIMREERYSFLNQLQCL